MTKKIAARKIYVLTLNQLPLRSSITFIVIIFEIMYLKRLTSCFCNKVLSLSHILLTRTYSYLKTAV